MNVSDAISYKRAVRQFSPLPVPEADILAILNAGRRSQSSKNSQPWQFITITDRTTLQSLSQLGAYASHLAGATFAVAIVHPDPGVKFQLLFDIGQTAAYMQLAAWELGIGSCIASIYEPDTARELLGFPKDHVLHFALSFGYPQDPEILTRPLKAGGRKRLDEMLHWNKW